MKSMRLLLLAFVTVTTVGTALAGPEEHATPVHNPHSPAYGHPYRHGVFPTRSTWEEMQAWRTANEAANAGGPNTLRFAATGPNTLAYNGGIDGIGVTSGSPRVYLVFWGNQWGTPSIDSNGNMVFSNANDPANAALYLQQLFRGLGTGGESWSGTMTQYCDGPLVAVGDTACAAGAALVGHPTGGALAGVWYDNGNTEPPRAGPGAIAREAIQAAGHFGNTSPAANRYVQYLVVSSTQLNPDGFLTGDGGHGGCAGTGTNPKQCASSVTGGFCAWHNFTGALKLGTASSPYGDIAFTNMPYVYDLGSECGEGKINNPGIDDGFSIIAGHEYAETLTDQNPLGGWVQQNGIAEDADECLWTPNGAVIGGDVAMGTGTFAMQSTWANDDNQCDLTHAFVSGSPTGTISSIIQIVTSAQIVATTYPVILAN